MILCDDWDLETDSDFLLRAFQIGSAIGSREHLFEAPHLVSFVVNPLTKSYYIIGSGLSSFGFIGYTHRFSSRHILLIHKLSFGGTVRAFELIGDGSRSIREVALALTKI